MGVARSRLWAPLIVPAVRNSTTDVIAISNLDPSLVRRASKQV